MTMEELIAAVADAYKNPKEGEADRNGNTRLSVLQETFGLSSLKVQKILVTADVYQPVKNNTPYEEVTRLRKDGKSKEEIMRITGLSAGSVSAYLPYEKSVYNADRNGAEITGAAVRKRRQRKNEEKKRINARSIVQDDLTDDSFWRAVMEHEHVRFVSTEGEKYTIQIIPAAGGTLWGGDARAKKVRVRPEKGGMLLLSKEEILGVLHNALELMSEGRLTDVSRFKRTAALPYVYPLLVLFGVVPGKREKAVTRRYLADTAVCACCGRFAVHTVRSYADLVRLSEKIKEDERSRWDPKDREWAESLEASMDMSGRKTGKEEDNAAIRAFDAEGERHFCTVCAQTIRMALSQGELPGAAAPTDLRLISAEAAESGFHQNIAEFPSDVRYLDRYGREYGSETAGGDMGMRFFCYIEYDRMGKKHYFAVSRQGFADYMRFEAIEIHRLTRAGNYARDYTGTDYEMETGMHLTEEEFESEYENRRMTHIGFLELINKVRDALQNPSLEWGEGTAAAGAVSAGGRQCVLKSTGQMQIVYIDEESVQGREWSGGKYGLLIDGRIFTGEEVACMASGHEGWNLQYRIADPSAPTLRAGEYLMPVQIGEKELVSETSELLNMFTADGRFISDHDEENFAILFEKEILKKLKLYHESNPGGYGRLAAMQIIKRLKWVEGTEMIAEQVRWAVQG